jgi:hypothetical protein
VADPKATCFWSYGLIGRYSSARVILSGRGSTIIIRCREDGVIFHEIKAEESKAK